MASARKKRRREKPSENGKRALANLYTYQFCEYNFSPLLAVCEPRRRNDAFRRDRLIKQSLIRIVYVRPDPVYTAITTTNRIRRAVSGFLIAHIIHAHNRAVCVGDYWTRDYGATPIRIRNKNVVRGEIFTDGVTLTAQIFERSNPTENDTKPTRISATTRDNCTTTRTDFGITVRSPRPYNALSARARRLDRPNLVARRFLFSKKTNRLRRFIDFISDAKNRSCRHILNLCDRRSLFLGVDAIPYGL